MRRSSVRQCCVHSVNCLPLEIFSKRSYAEPMFPQDLKNSSKAIATQLLVNYIYLLFLYARLKNGSQMFTIVRQSVAYKILISAAKVMFIQRGQSSDKIWKCVFGPFSHHLLRDWNINDHYHDYGCETCNLG
jgi:hypothetical protein